METDLLAKKINEIEIPQEMYERILRNCYSEREASNMNKRKTIRKSFVLAAALSLCLCLAGVTALARPEKISGFFKDIVRFDGAVTGTSYGQATDEINVAVSVENNQIIISTEILNPTEPPYSECEQFNIEKYSIIDADGNIVIENITSEPTEISNGTACFVLSAENIPSGNYTLIIEEFVSTKKADRPLIINGKWECEFNY